MKLIGFYDYTVVLTYLSLASALAGMVLGSRGRFTAGVLCLLLCGIFDAFDGIVARSKKDRTHRQVSFDIQIDSLVDVVAFGLFPAVLCYQMGGKSILGLACGFVYVLCAVIRLAFFNVLEELRQKDEGGGVNKYYRGLPVTTASMILPVFYILRAFMSNRLFSTLFCIVLVLMAFLFVLDFSVKKINWLRVMGLQKKREQQV
jgi:CDP-diacylglycerol--serine O-phosphatidyltransferase